MSIRILIVGAFILLSGSVLLATQHQHGQEQAQAAKPAQTPAEVKQRCEMMAQHMDQIHQKMEQMDKQLQEKLTAMREARGNTKVDAMAVVIEELVSQRHSMHEEHGRMMHGMMQHMGEHTAMGMEGAAHEAMMQCPMMHGPGHAAEEKPEGAAHENHGQ